MTILLAFLFLFGSAAALDAQIIAGSVWDTTSNSGVAAARVILLQIDSSQSVVTDSTGRFRFRAVPGMASLRVSALGYSDLSSRPFTWDHDSYSLLIYMSTTPIEVMPIHVIAKSRHVPTALELFEQRRKVAGSGYFLDEKALARAHAIQLSDYLEVYKEAAPPEVQSGLSTSWACGVVMVWTKGS